MTRPDPPRYRVCPRPIDGRYRDVQCIYDPRNGDVYCCYERPANVCSDEWPGEFNEFKCWETP